MRRGCGPQVGQRAGRLLLEVEHVHGLRSERVDVGGPDGDTDPGEGGADEVDDAGPVAGPHLEDRAPVGCLGADGDGGRQLPFAAPETSGRVDPAGAHVVWLDQVLPMYRKSCFDQEAVIGMWKSTNHRFRGITIFRRRPAE